MKKALGVIASEAWQSPVIENVVVGDCFGRIAHSQRQTVAFFWNFDMSFCTLTFEFCIIASLFKILY